MVRRNPETTVKEGWKGEVEETLPFKYSITSYGADYPVDGLVRRIKDGSIHIPPFQRGFVWKLKQASRFVESLLLGLPVPGIFLSRDEDTQKLLVIDGQQRLRTLQYFYDGIFHDTGREFALKDVQSQYKGATYKLLSEEDRRKLDDSIIHATIVRQDEPSEDNSSIFNIFERLNTGGELLHPQEVRAAMYDGEFNALIKELNNNESWRALFGAVSKRMRDRELILRFLALYYRGEQYEKPIKGFLNKYMAGNKHLRREPADEIRRVFGDTVETVRRYLGDDAFKPRKAFIAALFDAVMVGVARRLDKGEVQDGEALRRQYDKLMKSKRFIKATTSHTSDEDNLKSRIKLATEAFADVE
jgi:uncharacterized protein with ParB-like and HNH nuclease domain